MKKAALYCIMSCISLCVLAQQEEQKFAEVFLKSVQQKNFSLLKPYLAANAATMQTKWKQVVTNAHRKEFNINKVKISKVVQGSIIPNLPMKSIIVLYKYNDEEWDDLLLMISTDKKIKLLEIPLTSYMFMLNKDRNGKNLKDAENN